LPFSIEKLCIRPMSSFFAYFVCKVYYLYTVCCDESSRHANKDGERHEPEGMRQHGFIASAWTLQGHLLSGTFQRPYTSFIQTVIQVRAMSCMSERGRGCAGGVQSCPHRDCRNYVPVVLTSIRRHSTPCVSEFCPGWVTHTVER
jgi:hypothetical protein